jgi:hypothetical protein
MIDMEQHRKIHRLLEDWAQLDQLYTSIQTPGHLHVQVLGNSRPEFRDAAVAAAKLVLQKRADHIRGELKDWDFDIDQLPKLVEIPNDPEN